jgi:hypothetical protein
MSLPTDRRLASERRTWYAAAGINQLPLSPHRTHCHSGSEPHHPVPVPVPAVLLQQEPQ